MTTADQLVAHAVGDYVLQSDWMASLKTRQHVPAVVHALSYTLPFLLITASPLALAAIAGTHFVIDRWRLARYVVWFKNFAAPRRFWLPWSECDETGYSKERPPWMAVWLLIIADNTLHVVCNGLAILVFGEEG
jgi:hypothetical protein